MNEKTRKIVSFLLALMMLFGVFNTNLSAACANQRTKYQDFASSSLEDNQVWIYFYSNIPGDNSGPDVHLAYVGQLLSRPPDPSRPNYRVSGWLSTQSPAANRYWRFDSDRVPNIPGERLVLIAQWEPVPFRQEVRFNLQNDFGPQVNPNPVIRFAYGGIANTASDVSANLNYPADAPTPLWAYDTSGGARFLRWSVSPSSLAAIYNENIIPFTMAPPPTTQGDVVPLDVTRYAVFARQVRVTYFNNSISETTSLLEPFLAQDLAMHNIMSQLQPYQNGLKHVILEQHVGAPAGVYSTRIYDFSRWYIDEARTIPFASLTQLTFDTTGVANLYAGYIERNMPTPGPNQLVTLIYHNDDVNNEVTFYVPQGDTLYIHGNVNLPTRMPNAIFRGWTIGTDESRDFWVSGSQIMEPTVLEAVFSHVVTLNLDGGTLAESDGHLYATVNYVFTLPGLTGVTPPQHGSALTGVMHPYSPVFRRPDDPTHPTLVFNFWSRSNTTITAFPFSVMMLPGGTMHFATAVSDNIHLVARYGMAPRVTLTFNGGGGTPASFTRTPLRGSWTSSLSSTTATSMSGNIQRPMVPRHDGFHFTGWRNDIAPHDIWTFGTTVGNRLINDHHSFTAQWVPGFTVTFNSNGAVFASTQLLHHGDNASVVRRTMPQGENGLGGRLIAPSLTRAGFEFLGWFEDITDLNTRWSSGDYVTRDMNLTALWSGVSVLFDASPGSFWNGQTRVMVAPYATRIITNPPIGMAIQNANSTGVYRLGYSLIGWAYNGVPWDFSNPVYEGQVFRAIWQRTAIITFRSPLPTDTWARRTANLHNNMLVPNPGNPPGRTNFTFNGWFTQPDGNGERWDPTAPVNADMSLYAHWLNRYSVIFLLATNPNHSHHVVHGILEGSLIPTPMPVPASDSRGTFLGWDIYGTDPAIPWDFATDSLTRDVFASGSINGGPNPGPANPFGLVARWSYFPVVTLVFRDGTQQRIMTQPGQGGQFFAPLPTIPHYNLYRVLGWFERDESGNRIGLPITSQVPIGRDMRLYAEYERHSHNVTFVLGYDKADYVYPFAYNSLLVTPRRFEHPVNPDYTVIGWYFDSQLTMPIPSDFRVTEDVRVYARWGIIEYALVVFRNIFGEEIYAGGLPTRITIRFGSTIPTFPTVFDSQGRFIFENYWYIGEHGGAIFNPDSPVIVSALTLVASARHVVRFEANQGVLAPGTRSQEVRRGHGISPHAVNNPSREGYTFLGWFMTPAGDGNPWAFYGTTPHDVVEGNMTLYARWEPERPANPASAPWSSLPSGDYLHGFQFTLLHDHPNARIYYAFGYADPRINGNLFTGRNFSITAEMTINIVAIVEGYTFSNVVTYHYNVRRSTVTFDTGGGTPVPESVTVYTNRGLFAPAPPARDGYEFAGWYYGDTRWNFIGQAPNIDVSIVRSDMTLVARWLSSEEPYVAMPRSSLRSGEYPRGFQFAILHDHPDAVIHFTTDGTVPTADSPIYVRPITIDRSMTLKAIAVVNGVVSRVAIYHYTVAGAPPRTTMPWSTLPSGEYPAGFQFMLLHDHPNAVIHFTLDGTVPTINSPTVVSPGAITIYRDMTVMAIAFVEGYDVSEVAVYHYRIIGSEPEGRITALSMDELVGVVDNINNTITFRIPQVSPGSLSLLGNITNLVADANEIIFVMASYPGEHPRRLGDLAGFATGDIVFVADGIVYTLIIEIYPPPAAGRIYSIYMDGFVGVVDQASATITFTIPGSMLNDGSFVGTITELSLTAGHDTVRFIVQGFGNEEFPRSQGELAGFADGDVVFVADGVRYTLQINAI